jgi:hypothetical protein
MAILVSLFATMMLTCLGLTLALLGSAEVTLAGNDWQSAAATRAAEGALNLALSELRARDDWTGVLTAGGVDVCASPGALVDASLFPRAPWDGSLIDLHAVTATLQGAADAAAPPGSTPPVWRLFDYAPISRLIPASAGRQPWYLAVWTADGGDGVLLVHATALGPAGLAPSVDASVARRPDGRSLKRIAVRTRP